MLLEITLAILFAKIFSIVFEKIKQPGVLGEILAGVILGPCCIGLLSGSSINVSNFTFFNFNLNLTSPEFKEIAFIGAVFLLFIVGLETNMNDLKKTRKVGLGVGILGVITPFLFGCLVGTLFNLSLIQSMAIGTIFLATSTTIALRILTDMDLLGSNIGLVLRTALVINDVLAMVFFALVFGVNDSLSILAQISIFFIIVIVAGFLIVRYTLKKNIGRRTPVIALTISIGICFLFAAFAENMGLTAIIGAFIAGIFIRKTPQAGMLVEYIKTIGYAFFVPLFFVWVGASFNFLYIFGSDHMMTILIFSIAFIVFAMLGNFIGSTLGARITGMKRNEAISVGLGMMPVMGVALIMVSTGIDRGIFGDPTGFLATQVRTATVFLIFTSCFLSPLFIKRSVGLPILKKIGKGKTKPMFYHHPQCTQCGLSLRLNPEKNEWYCDNCQKFIKPSLKMSSSVPHKIKIDRYTQYIIGLVTIIILGLAIQNLKSVTLEEKIFSILGVFIGTTLAFLTLKYFLSYKKITT